MNVLKTTDLYSWGNCVECKLCLNKAVTKKVIMFSSILLNIRLRDSYPCYNIQPLLPHRLCMYRLHRENAAAFDFSSFHWFKLRLYCRNFIIMKMGGNISTGEQKLRAWTLEPSTWVWTQLYQWLCNLDQVI